MNIKVCKSSHRYDQIFASLPKDQGGEGRHKCCGCAYDLGFEHGKKGITKTYDFELILESQAGKVRHKSTNDAYDLGYEEGTKERLSCK